MKRVACFIDGFNLYHSFRINYHKWLDLNSLAEKLITRKSERISAVYYFSAYAKWIPASYRRHQVYVDALEATGVKVVLGHFKRKDRYCKRCGNSGLSHEEKETDVSIALYMLNEAHKGNYDKAMLITRDSDFAPILRMLRTEFPNLEIEIVAPPDSGHSNELIRLATSKKKIGLRQIEKSLFAQQVVHPKSGIVVAERPTVYDPPETG